MHKSEIFKLISLTIYHQIEELQKNMNIKQKDFIGITIELQNVQQEVILLFLILFDFESILYIFHNSMVVINIIVYYDDIGTKPTM